MKPIATYSTVILCLLILSGHSACGTEYTDGIAASVNGDVILSSDLKKHNRPAVRNILNLPLGVVPPGKVPTEQEILDELIVVKLLKQEADRKGVNVDRGSVLAALKKLRKRNNFSEDRFVFYLARSGVTYDEYIELMTLQFRLRKLIGAEVSSKLALDEQDAQQYFKAHRGEIEEKYDLLVNRGKRPAPKDDETNFIKQIPTHKNVYTGGRLRLMRITLRPKTQDMAKARRDIGKKARKIYREIETGADFSKLIKKYSDDSSGDLGWMRYKDLVKPVRKIVKHLEKGRPSRPIPLRDAVYIFYLADARGRTMKKVPIPEPVRKQYAEQLKKMAEERRKARKSAEEKQKKQQEKLAEKPDNGKLEPVKQLGILSPELEKEYQKVRNKVAVLVREKKHRDRMKEWIEQLKKDSIIDVKI